MQIIDSALARLRPRTFRSKFILIVGAVVVLSVVFFVLACQCMSTVAVVRRETDSWRWPLFMLVMMNVVAWLASFAVFQGGRLLGLG